jgi:hypothetical protein
VYVTLTYLCMVHLSIVPVLNKCLRLLFKNRNRKICFRRSCPLPKQTCQPHHGRVGWKQLSLVSIIKVAVSSQLLRIKYKAFAALFIFFRTQMLPYLWLVQIRCSMMASRCAPTRILQGLFILNEKVNEAHTYQQRVAYYFSSPFSYCGSQNPGSVISIVGFCLCGVEAWRSVDALARYNRGNLTMHQL